GWSCRSRGEPAHSASFHSQEAITSSKPAIKHVGCGVCVEAVADLKGEFVYPELGVINLLGGGIETNTRKPIVPITGPMQRILRRLLELHAVEHLIWDGSRPLASGAINCTQMIQRLVKRAEIDDELKSVSTQLTGITSKGFRGLAR
ncbi:hypothetical protein, partial [Paracoccus sp. (in: a-proteobacteria)]|uniref:hypothetical protein n=1 Tax=Paracoccus sp. TaxID=267 RepID=UPI00396CDEE8